MTAYVTPVAVRKQVDHLDDHKVQLNADGVTRPGQVTVIKGEGMPVFESVRSGAVISPRPLLKCAMHYVPMRMRQCVTCCLMQTCACLVYSQLHLLEIDEFTETCMVCCRSCRPQRLVMPQPLQLCCTSVWQHPCREH